MTDQQTPNVPQAEVYPTHEDLIVGNQTKRDPNEGTTPVPEPVKASPPPIPRRYVATKTETASAQETRPDDGPTICVASVSKSPSPRGIDPKIKTPMMFGSALKAITNGKRVRRLAWPNPSDHLFMRDGQVFVRFGDKDFVLIVTDGDILNEDWVTV